MRTGLVGEYKGQQTRSHAEFVFAAYLDIVLGYTFVTEPFSLKSKNNPNKRKVPDFLINDVNGKKFLAEIKANNDDLETIIVDYAVNDYIIDDNLSVKFYNLEKKQKKVLINKICQVIGKDIWNSIDKNYRDLARNTKKVFGFPGELNPRYGVKLSDSTKQKISNSRKGQFSGINNPNYNKTHTSEAKIKIGKKWYNQETKNNIVKKGMITHIRNFNNIEYDQFLLYANDKYNGIYHKRPNFVNRVYTISVDKIDNLFGSWDKFYNEIKR